MVTEADSKDTNENINLTIPTEVTFET